MKALSVKPPWPYAIFHPDLDKDIENRKIKYRESVILGDTIIQSSKSWDREGYLFIKNVLKLPVPPIDQHTFGRLEGIVNITGVLTESDSIWFSGPFGYPMTDKREFERKPRFKGSQGIFYVPEEAYQHLSFKE